MKHRFTAVLFCLIYVSVGVFFGVIHDHHDHGETGTHQNCAACSWQISAVADVPVVHVSELFASASLTEVLPYASPSLTPAFAAATASRAPPVAS